MTIRDITRALSDRLFEFGIENPRFEAEQLLQKAGLSRIKLLTEPNENVSESVEGSAFEMLERRVSGYPLQYILGEWEFFGLPFEVGEGVLIPRRDTEALVETARDILLERAHEERNTADLCAGSGCIGIALAKLYGARVKSYELSEAAFAYLERNIALNGVGDSVRAVLADVLDESAGEGEFDLIVSNPPYLDDSDMKNLQAEVTHEPKMALYGGADGLEFYRKMIRVWTRRLKRGGAFAVEIGMGQERGVIEIFAENGIKADCLRDMCGVYRVVYGVKMI
ncbi:MAG: peptide chain release factor N(5)-glutamine methyltransferase [Ruminococcaceae bacterium]|nr:peptide chain release factor N(5)-glutamine methyltransferase [Oscillospiraceae bacterium]